jgi:hypothetical protein
MGFWALVLLAACGDDAAPPVDGGTDAAVVPDAGVSLCEGFVVPERADDSSCDDVSVDEPERLVACARGSGHAGSWTIDAHGLPAYDLEIDQRCDPAGQSWSPRNPPDRSPLRDPIHLVGNGRGLVAMAHASGAIELYSQDRGHKWLNRVDTWRDRRNPDYPMQIGGGFNYVVIDGEVRSTRFEDLPVGEALDRQRRRFGAGYYETATRFRDVIVRRRTFAPDSDVRALVSEISIENVTDRAIDVGLVELWDVNLHQISAELTTSDLLAPNITEDIDRRRRRFAEAFEHQVSWDPRDRLAKVITTATAPPVSRTEPNDSDYYPDPIYLGVLDDAMPDAVWLDDRELWPDGSRPVPARAAGEGAASSATLVIEGEGQHVLLAMRVPVSVGPRATATRRFAFGYAPSGGDPSLAIASLRAESDLFARTMTRWRDRVVWAAFPGLDDAGVVQRELAWSSYNALANVTFDEYHGVRVLGQGGSYKYIHGLDGAIGDLGLFADAVLWIDPEVARDTLAYSLATQHASSGETPFRYPYATTGVGHFSDVGLYDQRSDVYWLLPSAIARYVAATGDDAFLDREVAFWPRGAESGTVIDHLNRTMDYALDELGFGARGLVAMGTGDYADGIHFLAEEPTTETGTSSVYNAMLIAHGFGLAADVVESRDPMLATRMREVLESQRAALEAEAWNGTRYERAFMDSGNPLAPDTLFLEPQVLPIVAGLADADRSRALFDLLREHLETPLGTMSTIPLSGEPMGGIDEPQIGGVWPIANAWTTEAYARHDPALGWDSFVRNTLARHATVYPDLWYGIWTGPDSYNGPDHARAGEADAHVATALTDYPALNVHVHTSPLRALIGLLGLSGTRDGVTIEPRVPTETFSVRLPRLELRYAPDRVSGRSRSSRSSAYELRVLLPAALRGSELASTVMGTPQVARIEGDFAVLELPPSDGPVGFEVRAR